ncbi:MAG TPA: hypothetical protein VKH13_01065, partial [Steroidobacteraceae bacterium]|nr:hypothetical protein [Steroidobacteraceae bacterium]
MVHDLDEFFGGENPWRLAPGLRIDHMFADVVFYDLRNEAVQCAPACGCLLQDLSALIVGLNGAFDRLDLTTQSFDSIQQLCLFSGDVAHGA